MLFRDPVQGTVKGLGFPPHWLPRGLALLPELCEPPLPPVESAQSCLDPSARKSAASEMALIQ